MTSTYQVQLRKNGGTMQCGGEILQVGDQILAMNSDVVEGVIVSA